MKFEVKFTENSQRFEASLTESSEVIQVEFSHFQNIIATPDSIKHYEGEYEVTPKVAEQLLSTAQRFLTEDLTVKKNHISAQATIQVATPFI